MSRIVNLTVSLAPMPLFVLGAVYSWFTPSVCGAHYEMFAMWAVMALAHTGPWIAYFEQRHYRRIQHLPHKQQ